MFHDTDRTEEQQMIHQFTVQLARDYGNHYFLGHARAETFPEEFWNTVVENGFLGLEAPEAHGGSAAGLADLMVLLHGLGEGGSSSHHLLGQLLCVHALSVHGNEAQQAEHLPALIQGRRWAYANQEATRGDDLAAIATKADESGDSVTLNGSKHYIACARDADFMIVTAQTGSGIGLYIVPGDVAGLEFEVRELNVRVIDKREPQAITGDVFCTVTLDGVEIPAANRIGAADGSVHQAVASQHLLMLAATAAGWGDRVVAQAVEYANQRVLYTQPISAYQAIQHPMVRAKTAVEMGKLLIERAVDAQAETDDADDLLLYAATAKQQATEGAFEAFDIAIQCHGGSAFDRDIGLITIWPLMLIARMMVLANDAILERFGATLLEAT